MLVTNNVRTMASVDLATNIFVYPLNRDYLDVPEVNPCINTFYGAISEDEAYYDGTVYSYELDFPATRVFPVEPGISCTESDPNAVTVYNNEGEVIDCTTSPFKFCGGILSFQSSDASWEGVHEFSALGFTWNVLPPVIPDPDPDPVDPDPVDPDPIDPDPDPIDSEDPDTEDLEDENFEATVVE